MGLKRTDEFRQDAVRIALTSGLTRRQVADDPLPDSALKMHERGRTLWVFPNGTPVQNDGCQSARSKGLPHTSSQSQTAIWSGHVGTHQGTIPSQLGQLWQV